MYQLHLAFESVPKSLNKKLQWGSKFKNIKENKAWDRLIYVMTQGKLPPTPLHSAKITIIRHSWRMLDYDGLVGSMKPVVDGLVFAKVLSDDSWGVTGQWNVDQKFRKKKDGSLLEVIVESRS